MARFPFSAAASALFNGAELARLIVEYEPRRFIPIDQLGNVSTSTTREQPSTPPAPPSRQVRRAAARAADKVRR